MDLHRVIAFERAADRHAMVNGFAPRETWLDLMDRGSGHPRVTGTGDEMTCDVATVPGVRVAMRERKADLTPAVLDLLLYFAQGHHLAWRGAPLFVDDLYASAEGVVLTPCDLGVTVADSGQLGTITHVVVRYGSLSLCELRTLIRASRPWQLARMRPDAVIEWNALGDWFRRPDDDPDAVTAADRAEAETYLTSGGRHAPLATFMNGGC